MLAESVLYDFTSASGINPWTGLTNVGGVFYGLTYSGGTSGDGTVFSILPSGVETTLYSFAGGSDGANPVGNLIVVKGTLYGTTEKGGADNDGTIFEIAKSGVETVLHSFTGGADGEYPRAQLTDVNGVLYGTTSEDNNTYYGTVFSIAPSGSDYTVLHDFAGGQDGALPYSGLTNVNGTLYGTTLAGGANNDGTIFSITTSGTEAVLHSFDGTDGAYPFANLTNLKSTLYGTTDIGGSSDLGTVFQIATNGSGFKTLYSFAGGTSDGANPGGQLIVLNGVLFGTTFAGGSNGLGTIFEVLPNFYGSEAVLYNFSGGSDGADPYAGLIKVKGTLYGTTVYGGSSNGGTIYKLLL